MLAALIDIVYFCLIRPVLKCVLRLWTGKCELHRLTLLSPSTARTAAIEFSLLHSKRHELKKLLIEDNVNIEEAVESIIQLKKVSPDKHPEFRLCMHECLEQICGYRQLISNVESLRTTPYTSENKDHETQLMQLWMLLRPDVELTSRVGSQWGEVGFQGDDPATDFRGMGLLGLDQLVYFARKHGARARQMLGHSDHPQYGYSFSIVGINLTALACQLLKDGHLKPHFYSVVRGHPHLLHFHHVYSCLLSEFDIFWFDERPLDIMEFNRIKTKFHKKIVDELKSSNGPLNCDFNRNGPPAKRTMSTQL